jgi:hypothetical protein
MVPLLLPPINFPPSNFLKHLVVNINITLLFSTPSSNKLLNTPLPPLHAALYSSLRMRAKLERTVAAAAVLFRKEKEEVGVCLIVLGEN